MDEWDEFLRKNATPPDPLEARIFWICMGIATLVAGVCLAYLQWGG